jgi:DNA polymerase III subunit gamma/tau
MAGKLSVPSLPRAWQMLLKGLLEVRDATRPMSACEMALIRLAYAADLPPTDKLVRDLLDGESRAPPVPATSAGESRGDGGRPRASSGSAPAVQRAPEPTLSAEPAIQIRSLEELAALALAKGAPVLKVHIENDMHLVHIETGKIEFRPSARAPRTLAGDLSQKLKDWTGMRWSISIASEGGAPTLAEQKKNARTAKFESVTQEPMVRAILDRFPGAEIKEVRLIADEDITPAMPDDEG